MKFFDANNNQLSTSNYGIVDLGDGGARWIPQLGLYDDRNRFMSPDLGRFLQPDPIGFKGDASNLYRYVGNDWPNRTDPTGLIETGTGMAANPEWFGLQKNLSRNDRLSSQRGAILGAFPDGLALTVLWIGIS